jgi:hypothetical protein
MAILTRVVWEESTSINFTHIDFTSKEECEHKYIKICMPLAFIKEAAKSAGLAHYLSSFESKRSTLSSLSI